MWKKTPLALCIFTLSTAVQAEVQPIFKFGVELGGDSLVETLTEDLNAGGGLYLGAGISITDSDPDALVYRATIGYLFDDIEFTQPSGDASTNAVPLNLGVFKQFDNHEFGLGLAYYIGPSFDISSSNCNTTGCVTIDFDDALGFTLEYNYNFDNSAFVGVKYTNIDYKIEDLTIDASSIGLYIGASFQ